MSEERLQKILSRAGISSRRKAEQLIRAGRVRVDGRLVTELGVRADPQAQRVELDGRRIVAEPLVYLVLHKPRGVVTTLDDPEGRPTVAELVRGVRARIFPVGRLDFHTSGALIMTNDGQFAAALAHPKGGAPKVYVAKLKGVVDDAGLKRLTQPILIDGRRTEPARVVRMRVEGDKTWVRITLSEGRNRQVHRLCEAAGFRVMRLVRTSHAGIGTEGLLPGRWRHLSVEELTELNQHYGVPRRIRAAELGAQRFGGPPRGFRARFALGRASNGARRGRSERDREEKAERGRFGAHGGPHRGRHEQSARGGAAHERFARGYARDELPRAESRERAAGQGRDTGFPSERRGNSRPGPQRRRG